MNFDLSPKKPKYSVYFMLLTQTTNFRLFQTERVLQTTISSLMKMEESSPKWLESTVGKGEIACYKQFLLFPQCFQEPCTADT